MRTTLEKRRRTSWAGHRDPKEGRNDGSKRFPARIAFPARHSEKALGGTLVGGCNSNRRHARQTEAVRSDRDRRRISDAALPGTMQVLSQRLGSINSGKARPQSVRTFGDFVKDDWMSVVLPTLKYATQKHYRYMLDVHLNPAFGQRQLRELTREELQSFLSRKLSNGLSWETVHHFKCGMSKILGAAEEWGLYNASNVASEDETFPQTRQHGPLGRPSCSRSIQVRDIAAVLNEPCTLRSRCYWC